MARLSGLMSNTFWLRPCDEAISCSWVTSPFTKLLACKKPSKDAVQFSSIFLHTVPISILSSSSLPSLKPSSASQPLLLLRVPPTPSRAYARLSLLALMKSLVLNVLPISLTQDINLNGKCSRCLHPHWKSLFCPVFICSASTPASDCRRADHCYGPPEIPVMKKLRALNKLQVDDLPRRVF